MNTNWQDKSYAGLTKAERDLALAALDIDCFVTFPANGRAVSEDHDGAFALAEAPFIVVESEDGKWIEFYSTTSEALAAIKMAEEAVANWG